MAVKSLSEQLLGLLDADTQAKVKAAFAANPALIAQDQKGTELIDVWSNFGGELETPAASAITTTTTASTAHTPTLPSAAATAAAAAAPVTTTTAASSNNTADGMARILAELEGLKTKLDKDYVPAAKLPEYRAELLTLAIKSADDYASVRENHRAEFNEPLDRNAFEKFVADNKAANVNFRSMAEAHDVFVKDKRSAAATAAEKSRIDAAVAEALKQQRSGAAVPGQTQTTGLSPAQQVIAKAKANGGAGGADSAAMQAAKRLEELDRSRASVQ